MTSKQARAMRDYRSASATDCKVSRIRYFLDKEAEALEYGVSSIARYPKDEIISVLIEANDLISRITKNQ